MLSTEYHIEQYRAFLGTDNRGTMFTLTSSEQVNDSTLLFRFIIGITLTNHFHYAISYCYCATLQTLDQPLHHHIKMD